MNGSDIVIYVTFIIWCSNYYYHRHHECLDDSASWTLQIWQHEGRQPSCAWHPCSGVFAVPQHQDKGSKTHSGIKVNMEGESCSSDSRTMSESRPRSQNMAAVPDHHRLMGTRLPKGTLCGEATCCSLWVQCSNPGCSILKQTSRISFREEDLALICPQSMVGKCVTNASQRTLYLSLMGGRGGWQPGPRLTAFQLRSK